MDSVATPDAKVARGLGDNAVRLARGNSSADMAQVYALAAVTEAILYFADIYENHHKGLTDG